MTPGFHAYGPNSPILFVGHYRTAACKLNVPNLSWGSELKVLLMIPENFDSLEHHFMQAMALYLNSASLE